MLPPATGDHSAILSALSQDGASLSLPLSHPSGKDTVFCDYCRKLRNTRETCWKVHGAPLGSRGDWFGTRGG